MVKNIPAGPLDCLDMVNAWGVDLVLKQEADKERDKEERARVEEGVGDAAGPRSTAFARPERARELAPPRETLRLP